VARVRAGSAQHRALAAVRNRQVIWQDKGRALQRVPGLASFDQRAGWSLTSAGEQALRQADLEEKAAKGGR
jgi:hypothetical protein